jgi:hypothetical protein
VLSALLQRDPAKRPDAAAARQMLQELATSLNGEGCRLPWRIGNPRPSWRSRHRVIAAAVCLATPLIVAGNVVSHPYNPAHASLLAMAYDVRSADPCALTDTAVFARFGPGTQEPALGNFNRCDVTVRVDKDTVVGVKVELEPRAGATIGGAARMQATWQPGNGDSCVRTLQSASQNQVTNRATITVKLRSGHRSSGDLCAMADAATRMRIPCSALGQFPDGVRHSTVNH